MGVGMRGEGVQALSLHDVKSQVCVCEPVQVGGVYGCGCGSAWRGGCGGCTCGCGC